MMMTLPNLADHPKLHIDCCPSLSASFIMKLASILPTTPSLTLSIGSGSGLVEALLLHERNDIHVRAVEVLHNVNKYLPREFM